MATQHFVAGLKSCRKWEKYPRICIGAPATMSTMELYSAHQEAPAVTTGREQSRVRMLRTKKSSRVDRADITGESRSNRWRTGVFSFL